MKHLIYSIALLFMSIATMAQSSSQPIPEKVKQQLEILKSSDLNLTDVQIGRITTVLTAENQKVERMSKINESNQAKLQEDKKTLKAIMINNLKGAMTPLQVEKFDTAKLAEKL